MSTAAVSIAASPRVRTTPTLLSLARADARRFARHPLFLFGALSLAALAVGSVVQQSSGNADTLAGSLLIALALGVFGFVVAHRLTTSLRRSGELAETAPVSQRQRTAALCLACLVPAATATVMTIFMIITGDLWPPEGATAEAHVAWFGDEPAIEVLAMLIAAGPVAALGGPILGVAVARWAPFRGSALVGVVLLIMSAVMPSEASGPWRALTPWAALVDLKVVHSELISSSIVDDVSPQWYLAFVLCLCGLAAVAALLRDPIRRAPYLWTGLALVLGAGFSYTMAVV
ncbi:MAG: hypothetical protein ACRDO2_05945 [Nocardioidaceae bacterium]